MGVILLEYSTFSWEDFGPYKSAADLQLYPDSPDFLWYALRQLRIQESAMNISSKA